MKKILLATHLSFAKAILESLEFIVGEQESVESLCAYTPEVPDLAIAVEEYVKKILPGDEIIVVTDVYGGSVNNEFMKYIDHPGIYLVSGLSLPLLIELVTNMELKISEQIQTAIENTGKAIDCKKAFENMRMTDSVDTTVENGI